MGFYTLYKRPSKKGVIYYYRVNYPNGTRSAGRSTHQKTKTTAHTYCQQLIREGRLWTGTDSTFSAYAQNWFKKGSCPYIADRLAESIPGRPGISDATIKRYALNLNEYLIPYFGKMKLGRIQPEHVRAFRVWMREERELSANSINNAICVLKIMVTWALDNHLIFFDPTRGIKPLQAREKARDAFQLDEVLILLSGNWDSPVAWLYNVVAACTGMRLGEIRAIRRGNIYPGYLDVADQYQNSLIPVKTKERRKIPLPAALWALLWVSPAAPFVFSDPGKADPWGTRKATAPLDKLIAPGAKRDRGLCFHSWRKFFNTWLLSENITGEKIRAVMGHSSGAGMTEKVYASWRPEIYPEVYRAQEKLVNLLLENNPMLERFIALIPAHQ
jgi:integrase